MTTPTSLGNVNMFLLNELFYYVVYASDCAPLAQVKNQLSDLPNSMFDLIRKNSKIQARVP